MALRPADSTPDSQTLPDGTVAIDFRHLWLAILKMLATYMIMLGTFGHLRTFVTFGLGEFS